MACLHSPPLAAGGSRLYCVPPTGAGGGGQSRPCLDTRPPCHLAITCVGPAVGGVLELADEADVAVAVGAWELEGALELEVALELEGAWEVEGAWELGDEEVVDGVAVAAMVVVGVTILGMTGQQTRSSHGFLSHLPDHELQDGTGQFSLRSS